MEKNENEMSQFEESKKLLKSYLKKYCEKKKRKRVLEKRLADFRTEMLGVKAVRYSITPRSQTNSINNEPLDIRIRCEEIEERIKEEKRGAALEMLRVMDIMDYLEENSVEKEILEYKYLDGYRWDNIARLVSLSRTQCVFHWNRGIERLLGFKKIQKIIEEYKAEYDIKK